MNPEDSSEPRSPDPSEVSGWSKADGHGLREMRVEAKLTQDQLAEKLGVTRTQVSRIESATNGPSARVLRAWYEACGYTVEASKLGGSHSMADVQDALVGMSDDELHAVARFARFWRRIPVDLRRAFNRFFDGYLEP